MSGQVHIVSDALYSLSALIQNNMITTMERCAYADLIRKSTHDELAYHELLYKIKVSQKEIETAKTEEKEQETALRLWQEFYEAVEGSQSQ